MCASGWLPLVFVVEIVWAYISIIFFVSVVCVCLGCGFIIAATPLRCSLSHPALYAGFAPPLRRNGLAFAPYSFRLCGVFVSSLRRHASNSTPWLFPIWGRKPSVGAAAAPACRRFYSLCKGEGRKFPKTKYLAAARVASAWRVDKDKQFTRPDKEKRGKRPSPDRQGAKA